MEFGIRFEQHRWMRIGYWLLKKTTYWKIIFNGSQQPPCSLGVPRDLTTCFHY